MSSIVSILLSISLLSPGNIGKVCLAGAIAVPVMTVITTTYMVELEPLETYEPVYEIENYDIYDDSDAE